MNTQKPSQNCHPERQSLMKTLFEVKQADTTFYQDKLGEFVPEKIIDIHAHLWLRKFRTGLSSNRAVGWPLRVAADNSIEDLLETYRLLFAGKHVTPLMFSFLDLDDDFEMANEYVRHCAQQHNLPCLIFASPRWSAQQFEDRILAGGFLGAKVYFTLSEPYIPRAEIRIFDFLPHHQLDVLDKHGWIVMLHIPRDGRLKDPVNLAQMLEIEHRYPNVKVIIAHAGRAYCPEDVGGAFDVLSQTKNMVFDTAANTNAQVFEQLIRAVGPRRVMFGSDLPFTRMRMRRICENGTYINLVPKGHYGDVSDDKHMREVEAKESEKLSFFLYEEIEAFRIAAGCAELTRSDIADVFYHNASRLIASVNNQIG